MKAAFFYVPFPSRVSAKKAIKILLKERLIACGNLWSTGESIYCWKGKVEQSRECYVLFKTTSRHRRVLARRIEALHPYDVPCVAELNVTSVNRAFLKWLEDSTD